jgi:hypothetical protein
MSDARPRLEALAASPDAAAIDAALVARLTDPALAALMPGGPFFDVGAKGHTAMVIVSLTDDATREQFGGAASERSVYLVKAVALDTSGSNVSAAAARIHALLQWDTGPAPLVIAGFDLMALRRVERVRYTEVDPTNADQRWQHQGGLYEVIVAPLPPAAAADFGATHPEG